MTDKELHRNTLIFAGIVILALILWAYFHGQIQAAINPFNPPSTVNQNPGVSFDIMGQPTVTGPINFPQAIYNIPPGPSDGVYSPDSCSCGCSGGNSGPLVYTFPDLTSYYTQVQVANNNALSNILGAVIGALPYDESVFVGNNSPTIFS
jgi:hypothetical protein